MLQGQRLVEIDRAEHREDRQGDDLLHRLQFGGRIDLVTDAVGRNGEAIFEKGDAPTHHDREWRAATRYISGDHTRRWS